MPNTFPHQLCKSQSLFYIYSHIFYFSYVYIDNIKYLFQTFDQPNGVFDPVFSSRIMVVNHIGILDLVIPNRLNVNYLSRLVGVQSDEASESSAVGSNISLKAPFSRPRAVVTSFSIYIVIIKIYSSLFLKMNFVR